MLNNRPKLKKLVEKLLGMPLRKNALEMGNQLRSDLVSGFNIINVLGKILLQGPPIYSLSYYTDEGLDVADVIHPSLASALEISGPPGAELLREPDEMITIVNAKMLDMILAVIMEPGKTINDYIEGFGRKYGLQEKEKQHLHKRLLKHRDKLIRFGYLKKRDGKLLRGKTLYLEDIDGFPTSHRKTDRNLRRAFPSRLKQSKKRQKRKQKKKERKRRKRKKRPYRRNVSFAQLRKRRPPRHCEVCGRATEGGKEFCVNHSHLMPYFQEISAQREKIEEEFAKVGILGKDVIKPDSITAKDIVNQLAIEDNIGIGTLARTTGVPLNLIEDYIEKLSEWGLVKTEPGKKTTYVFYVTDKFPEVLPKRALTRSQVVEALGIDPATLRTWVRKGAPHDRQKREGRGGHPIHLFNLEELAEWRERTLRAGEQTRKANWERTWGKSSKKRPRSDVFWEKPLKDIKAGMAIKKVARKHKIGEAAIRSKMQEMNIRLKPHRTPVEEVAALVQQVKRKTGLNARQIERQYGFTPKSLGTYRKGGHVKTVPTAVAKKLREILENY